jgi:hypothetical protein
MGKEISFENFPSSKDLWEFPIDDFLLLARPSVHGLYILNPSARLIWDILKAGVPLADLVRELASAYDIPREIAEQDVARTLDDWRSTLLAPQPISSSPTVPPKEIRDPPTIDFFARDYLIQGKNVRVILQTSELADEIAPRLESLPPAPSAPDFTFRVVEHPDGFRILCNECSVASEESVGATRAVLLQEIVRSCRGRDCLAVFHAGASGSNSRCVVFPASTHSGKTTLAAVLMKTGMAFYSDDSVLLERDTLSVPVMPFALTVREGSWDVLYPRFPELQDTAIVTRYGQRVRFLPPVDVHRDHPCGHVAAIVFVQFRPDATNQISPLDKLQTLVRLQESGFWVAHDEQSIRTFLEWIQSTPSFAMTYSDVDQAASMIRPLVG